MVRVRPWSWGLVSLLVLSASGSAGAQIYKYRKPDGTVAYTDRLSDLPKERRAYYDKLRTEEEKKRRALESRIGREELERREAERARKVLVARQMAAAERQRRLRVLDAQLAVLRNRRKAREDAREEWAGRMKRARKRQGELLEAFRKTQKAYDAIAIKPSFTLLPGEGDEMQRLRARLEELEKQLDAAIHQVNVVIPTEARKAGVPPGWLRT